jgi:kynureninase
MDSGLTYARQLDAEDPLASFRDRFRLPMHEDKPQCYFLGNSLGLQPHDTQTHIQQVLDQWARYGVEAFFMGQEPWLNFHDQLTGPMARLVGAKPSEISIMNQLTVNLHLLLVSFYRPVGKKRKILCEKKAFPSDQYMLETHVSHLGYDPDDVILEVPPEDILQTIEQQAEELALVFLGGLHYYTGEVLDMKTITSTAKAHAILIGYDLAHAAGNIPLELHDWEVDFAAWCTYKYLNAGPGAVGAVFIHERYHHRPELHRFAGWFGYEKATRFQMQKGFKPVPTAEGWQLSTPSILLYACLQASLALFEEAGWTSLQKKQHHMKAYLWSLLTDLQSSKPCFEILTPKEKEARGAQLSLYFPARGREIYDALMSQGIIVDWREPNVIRLAPVPLYNTFTEIWRFATALKELL